jgi:hypothetical protein
MTTIEQTRLVYRRTLDSIDDVRRAASGKPPKKRRGSNIFGSVFDDIFEAAGVDTKGRATND